MLDCVIIVLDFVRSFLHCLSGIQTLEMQKDIQKIYNAAEKARNCGIRWTLYLNTVLIIATL